MIFQTDGILISNERKLVSEQSDKTVLEFCVVAFCVLAFVICFVCRKADKILTYLMPSKHLNLVQALIRVMK